MTPVTEAKKYKRNYFLGVRNEWFLRMDRSFCVCHRWRRTRKNKSTRTDQNQQSSSPSPLIQLFSTMFRLIPAAARRVSQCSTTAPRAFSTVGTAFTASDAAELSGYKKIDFCIDEDAPVIDAVRTFVAHNIGCLVTTNSNGKLLL